MPCSLSLFRTNAPSGHYFIYFVPATSFQERGVPAKSWWPSCPKNWILNSEKVPPRRQSFLPASSLSAIPPTTSSTKLVGGGGGGGMTVRSLPPTYTTTPPNYFLNRGVGKNNNGVWHISNIYKILNIPLGGLPEPSVAGEKPAIFLVILEDWMGWEGKPLLLPYLQYRIVVSSILCGANVFSPFL